MFVVVLGDVILASPLKFYRYDGAIIEIGLPRCVNTA